MSVIIQLRRDTAANWQTVNPVLEAGEMGFESDTNQVKVGNGYHTWNVLPYSFDNPFNYVTEAPADNFQYARSNNAWVKVESGLPAPVRVTAPAGSITVIESLDASVYRSAKWMITVTDTFNGNYRSQETMALHDGTSASHTNYSIFGTVIPYSVDVHLSGNNLLLRLSNSAGVSLQVDAVRIANLVL